MPQIRQPQSVRNDRELVGRIRYGMEISGFGIDDMCLAARMSRPTWFSRLRNPGAFTLDELRRVSAKLKIPLPALTGDIPIDSGRAS